MPVLVVLRKIQRKAIPRIVQPQSEGCVHRGLGRRLNKQKTICSANAEWMVFSHLYIQMHCLLLWHMKKTILQIRLEIYLNNPIISWFYIAKFYLKRYNVKVSTSSQIRLQMVHRNMGGIVSSDMDDFVCGTCLPPSDSICIYITHPTFGRDMSCKCVSVWDVIVSKRYRQNRLEQFGLGSRICAGAKMWYKAA